MTAHPHLTVQALALHLLLQRAQRLIDIVVANVNFHESLFSLLGDQHKRAALLSEADPLALLYHAGAAEGKPVEGSRADPPFPEPCIRPKSVAMTLLKIARMGHPVLTRIARPVEDPTAQPVRRLVAHMAATMADAEGIGLAAPQVYQPIRLILFLDASDREHVSGSQPVVLINPEIEPLSDAQEHGLEGCLSIPGLRGLVPRFTRIGYRGLALDGRTIEREADGLPARVVQHEVDHLDGILYPMRMTDLRHLAFESEIKHFAKELAGSERA